MPPTRLAVAEGPYAGVRGGALVPVIDEHRGACGDFRAEAQASCSIITLAHYNVFALSGDVCAATGPSYNPPPTLSPPLPTPPPTFPVSYTGFAFFAYNGGVITSTGGVTIIANNNPAPTPPALPESNAYGVWSDGGRRSI